MSLHHYDLFEARHEVMVAVDRGWLVSRTKSIFDRIKQGRRVFSAEATARKEEMLRGLRGAYKRSFLPWLKVGTARDSDEALWAAAGNGENDPLFRYLDSCGKHYGIETEALLYGVHHAVRSAEVLHITISGTLLRTLQEDRPDDKPWKEGFPSVEDLIAKHEPA